MVEKLRVTNRCIDQNESSLHDKIANDDDDDCFYERGVSTEYRPDRACHPHFSYGAAHEGF